MTTNAAAPLATQLAFLVAQADRRLSRQLSAVLRDADLPVEQWRVLEILCDGTGRTVSELADRALLNMSALSKMIDRMASRALIFRAPDPTDGRRVQVFISDHGLDLHRRLKPDVERCESSLQRRLGRKSSAELKRLLSAFVHQAD
jgi:DNA-binding MarR family transcriptional regulator